MRFISCLLYAACLTSSVNAFYPYTIKVDLPISDFVHLNKLGRRFFPWVFPDGVSDAASTDSIPTFELKKTPRRVLRRENNYHVLKGPTPDMPDSAAVDQDGENLSYFITAKFGSPGKNMYVLLDTGGTSTWVFDSNCTAPACLAHDVFGPQSSTSLKVSTTTWSVGYGSGSVSGVMATDSILLAGLHVQMDFGLATNASNNFLNYPMDGILGLGRSSASDNTVPTFMDIVAQDKLLKSNIMAISLSRASDGGKNGEVTFGAVDLSKFIGNITYTAAEGNNSQWIIPMDDASVNGTPCNFSGKSAIIDTGTSYVLIPPNDAKTLHSLIPGAMQAGSIFNIPCNSSATVRFIFSGIGYTISPRDYVGMPVPGSTTDCISTIVGQQTFGPDDWLVGDVFLKNVYSVFDYDNSRLGFAGNNASYPPIDKSGQPVVAVANTSSTTSAGSSMSQGGSSSGSSGSTSGSSAGSAASSTVTTELSRSGASDLTVTRSWPVLLILCSMVWA